jgi:amino acid transporter
MPKPSTVGNSQTPAAFSYGEGILLIAGFITVSVVFAAFVALVNGYTSAISLPLLSIVGIILLLLFLAGIAYVFTRIGMQDPTQALGLPPGSIQAVIALSLIVLFAILSVFVFTTMGEATLRSLPRLSESDRDKEVVQLGTSFAGWESEKDGTFTIFVRDPVNDTQKDTGKQLIVLMGTLMTSAVSFYFGSRATAAGTAAANSTAAASADPAPSAGTPVDSAQASAAPVTPPAAPSAATVAQDGPPAEQPAAGGA